MLDLSGVTLDGEGNGGVGIWVHDCDDVTIENGVLTGFHYGIQAHNVSNLNIRGCVVSDNTNPTDAGWLPDTVAPVEEGFGGGIYLYKVRHSVIENNQLNNNFNGVSLVRSEHNVIGGNHASYCGNVGIYLLRSSHNEVLHNLAEHCIRYTDRFWCDTADSAGILLEDGSNHNRIVGNSLRYSGDGFFIRAHNREPSNHNFISGNDGSYSPNNAFEAVFSSENVFEDNVANYSNYGFWLGYSTKTTVKTERNKGLPVRRNRHRARAGQPHRGQPTSRETATASAFGAIPRRKGRRAVTCRPAATPSQEIELRIPGTAGYRQRKTTRLISGETVLKGTGGGTTGGRCSPGSTSLHPPPLGCRVSPVCRGRAWLVGPHPGPLARMKTWWRNVPVPHSPTERPQGMPLQGCGRRAGDWMGEGCTGSGSGMTVGEWALVDWPSPRALSHGRGRNMGFLIGVGGEGVPGRATRSFGFAQVTGWRASPVCREGGGSPVGWVWLVDGDAPPVRAPWAPWVSPVCRKSAWSPALTPTLS